ncbi:MAG: 3-hydroxyacyl-ACP dehydratase FabZ family protein [Planctomycetota bacterium]|nr:3-hydroxyacyl-ACP dehydratase FabZ family protein [Planctomycetota bacterium]
MSDQQGPGTVVLDRAAIESLIPHREPFLWLDEVVELTETLVRARKRVPEDLPVFAGHYPEFPVLPGVLLCEAAFQAGAVLIAAGGDIPDGLVPVVTRQQETRFRRMVRPGDVLDIEAGLDETLGGAWFLTGKVSVDGQVAVRLQFACTATETR